MLHPRSNTRALPVLALATLAVGGPALGDAPAALDSVNVVWSSPSFDHNGSMPLGNGEIGVNAWVDPLGDLHFYIGRIDSWSEGGHLLKVGKVRISLSPQPLVRGAAFRQELDLRHGAMVVRIDGDNPTELRLWVDANHPVIHVTTQSERPLKATAHIESWRMEPYTPAEDSRVSDPYSPLQSVVEPDILLEGPDDRIGWYRHNDESFGPEETMRFQDLDGYQGFVDPLVDRTFGAVVLADGGHRVDATTLVTEAGEQQSLRVFCIARHPSDPADWMRAMGRVIKSTERAPLAERTRAHEGWWREFWDRSWVFIQEAEPTARAALPHNDHLVRVGIDQHGGNVFRGEMGRVAVYGGALGPEEITSLLGRDHTLPPPTDLRAVYCGFPQQPLELPDSAQWDRLPQLTVEAWIRPQGAGMVGRIVDKVTPGVDDGLLLDTHPGDRLRLIVGPVTLRADRPLPSDEWSHVVAAVTADGPRLYQNGVLVAAGQGDSAPDAAVVTRGYTLQRYMNACAGRGDYPIKFNGSIFTVPSEGAVGDADYRRWGPGYWWQNTRLPYISMCASGDFDLMQPLFRMYVDEVFPLCEYRVQRYFGFRGAYFPECIHSWGAVFPDTYGHDAPASEREDKLQTSGYHKWEWVCGPELVDLMLDYAAYTGDEAFTRDKTLPVARAIAEFFGNYYPVGPEGKLVMHPAQAAETWWEVTDPMPELAGLIAMSERILALPESVLRDVDRPFWRAFRAKLPDLPLRDTPDGPALAPGREYANKGNIENPELYAVYPFRLVAVGRPNLEWGINALRYAWDRGSSGWRQDDIFMAYLGLAEEARETVVQRARSWHEGSRFPAFWGPNYDWIPDQDHGGVLLKAVQSLLMQVDGDSIYLLPAWPEGWNADFKLHAPRQTTVQASVRDGRITALTVDPPERLEDVFVMRQP
jgi:hypothetical protein